MMVYIYLYPEAANRFDIILRFGLHRRGGLPGLYEPDSEKPAVAGSLYLSLIGQYGTVVGAQVFEKMFEERKGPFGEDAKYDPDKRSVARKIAKAGGLIPDPAVKLQAFIAKRR